MVSALSAMMIPDTGLDQPYGGIFSIPSTATRNALADMVSN
jgi:hypothetical protein